MSALQVVMILLRQLVQSRAALIAENLALRHQIVILQRSVKRPRLHRRDRVFWVWLFRLWRGWQSSLIVVQPETVLRWHRKGFRLYWRWRSWSRFGRPKLDAEIRVLIRRMSHDNPTWGQRRIRSELHLLGYEVGELTVAKYMVRGGKPPSQGWRVFLKNHSHAITAIDFFTFVTLNFRILLCCGFYMSTSRIATTRGPTSPSTAMLPGPARLIHRARGGSWPSPGLAVFTTGVDARPEHRPTSRSSRRQPTSRRATLGAELQPRGLSEHPASLAGLPIHPPIAGRSAEMTSGRDDLIDRHIRSYLKEVTVRAIRSAGTVTLPSDLN